MEKTIPLKIKKATVQIPTLKLPANPNDLINMYDLKDRMILQKALGTNMQDYITNYHNSFIKTGAEWLEIIPESKRDEYQTFEYGCDVYSHIKKSIDKTERFLTSLYMVNFDTKIMYSAERLKGDYHYELNGHILMTRKMSIGYSTMHRDWNPHYTYKYAKISVYNLNTNSVVCTGSINMSAKFSGYMADNSYDFMFREATE
jgi:hypothetical protein